jgi:hypothetical protein
MSEVLNHAPARRIVAGFVATIVLAIALGSVAMSLGPVQGYLLGLRRSVPPALQPHVDAFLVPYWAAFLAATLVGVAITSAARVVRTAPSSQAALAWTCVALGLAGAVAMYWWGGYALPLGSRRALFGPGGVHRYSADFPPHLLTNEELAHVQAFLRRQGGYSPRVALMWQLRVWCALTVPVAGLLAALAVAKLRSGRYLPWLLGTEGVVLAFWLIGSMVAVGPAAFARPTAVPQGMAWGVLVAVAALAAFALRRALMALDAAEYQRVLDALANDDR